MRDVTGINAFSAASVIVLLILGGCGEQPDLPVNVNVRPEDFGANDTSFVRINPDWNAAHGYAWTQPSDIQVGRDGLLYVVDQSPVDVHVNGRVVQVNRRGTLLRTGLFASAADTASQILGIGQDSKLNLYMVNGTDVIYAWNQYVEQVGIQSLVQGIIIQYDSTGEIDTLDNATPLFEQFAQLDMEYEVIDVITTNDPDSLAPLTNEYAFYRDTTRVGTEFTDIDGGVEYSGLIYAADRNRDRIIGISVAPLRAMILNNGELALTYYGIYAFMVVSFGQGQASTNNPTCVVSENLGNQTAVYFTQTAGNFLVQKVKGAGEEWFFDIVATPEGEPEVITLNYFGAPHAIAIGERDERGLGLFYVADSLQNRVIAFRPNGFFFREVAAEEQLVDLEAGEWLEDVLTEMGLEYHPEMNRDLGDDCAAAVEVSLPVNAGEMIEDALEAVNEAEYGGELVYLTDLIDAELHDWVAVSDTILDLTFGRAQTVRVRFPVLDRPQGVATLEGVVYIADTGNDRVLRYRRTDSTSYLPDEGD